MLCCSGLRDGALYSTCVWPITFKQPARRERGAGGCPCFLAILVPSHWEHVGSVGLTGTLGGVGPLSIRITARLTLSHVSSRYRLVRVREPHRGGGGRQRSILLLQTNLEGKPLDPRTSMRLSMPLLSSRLPRSRRCSRISRNLGSVPGRLKDQNIHGCQLADDLGAFQFTTRPAACQVSTRLCQLPRALANLVSRLSEMTAHLTASDTYVRSSCCRESRSPTQGED